MRATIGSFNGVVGGERVQPGVFIGAQVAGQHLYILQQLGEKYWGVGVLLDEGRVIQIDVRGGELVTTSTAVSRQTCMLSSIVDCRLASILSFLVGEMDCLVDSQHLILQVGISTSCSSSSNE